MSISRFRRLAVVSAFLLSGLSCCISARYLSLNPEIPYGDALGFFMLVLLPVLLAGAIGSTLILRSETLSSITLSASFALLFVLMHHGWIHDSTNLDSTQWWDTNRIFGLAVLYSVLLVGIIRIVGMTTILLSPGKKPPRPQCRKKPSPNKRLRIAQTDTASA